MDPYTVRFDGRRSLTINIHANYGPCPKLPPRSMAPPPPRKYKSSNFSTLTKKELRLINGPVKDVRIHTLDDEDEGEYDDDDCSECKSQSIAPSSPGEGPEGHPPSRFRDDKVVTKYYREKSRIKKDMNAKGLMPKASTEPEVNPPATVEGQFWFTKSFPDQMLVKSSNDLGKVNDQLSDWVGQRQPQRYIDSEIKFFRLSDRP
ncbi:hypothetical protein BC939DRAFT_467264 [Gamsiella multidivaricata]|uniref:uncharacterized protein n=1 Tax=Gamsiella multidivaricata TaxID=101098 RepID=UPI0022210912|nr:uncharacterized protein BC939DRAFT_467264 [Gamsiella multidivaricata]KAI7816992.1 hypothetical protein BC939DRAFT_467264 [Gamsiella multidivaricata]